jgi:hypothetical protein
MGRWLTILGAIVGVITLLIVAVLAYAYFNLNSIIASNRSYIVAQASSALGRRVQIQNIKATLGWGVKVAVSGVTVADDPNFSELPFLQATGIYVDVKLLPLLSRSVKVTKLEIEQPQLRIIRGRTGTFNFSNINGNTGPTQPPTAPSQEKTHNAAGLAALTVGSLKVDDGTVLYADRQSGSSPIKVNNFNLAIDNFAVSTPFDVTMSLAAMGNRRDLTVSGKIGPLMRAGRIQTTSVPISLNAKIGPVTIAQLRNIPQLASAIPPALSIAQPITIDSQITGSSDAPIIAASADLSNSQVNYDAMFSKAANVPFEFSATAVRKANALQFNRVELVLASLRAHASDVLIQPNNYAARIDTNNFDLVSIAKVLTPLRRYNLTGNAQIHSTVRLTDHRPSGNGVVTFADVNAMLPGTTIPPVRDLSGAIRMAGNTSKIGPISFKLGSNPARLQAVAQSLQPLRATYQFNAAIVNIGDLVSSRRVLGEHLNQLAVNGNLSQKTGGKLYATTNLTSGSGMAANIPYRNLVLAAIYDGTQLKISSLKLDTFSGTIGASGVASTGADHSFNLRLNVSRINVQQALAAQRSKAADILRGVLTGNVQVAGAGRNFAQIKPTLRGDGSVALNDGKLLGVNVVGQALRKVDNLPAIGALIPASVAARHPELFRSNDTDIQHANLTFVLQGPRLITHDLNVTAADYSVLGNGWFDMDKNVNLTARVLLSPTLSSELVTAKHNIAYLTGPDNRVEIPLRMVGQLPKPLILPDVKVLAQRAVAHAAQREVGKLLGKKGSGPLGGLMRGGGTKGNPLNQLKGLFK